MALSTYRSLPARAGGTFLPIAFGARLPLAMTQIGTLLMVTETFSSYAAGGLAAGLVAVGTAVGGPLIGLLTDHYGQRRVVVAATILNALLIVGLVAAASSGAPLAVIGVAAALVGLTNTQIGSLARTRWIGMSRRDRDRELLTPAMSYESAADETTFALGPAVVGAVIALWSPPGALLVAALLAVTCGPAFALHRSAEFATADPLGVPADPTPARFGWGGLVALVPAMMLLGCVFGGIGAGATALTTALGTPAAAGAVVAVLGVSSALAGLATAYIPARIRHTTRLVVAATGLALLTPLLMVANSMPLAIAVFAVVGCAVAPYMISVYALGERVVPPHRIALTMTILASGVVIGYAVGSGTAGALADAGGPRWAFAVPIVASWLAVVLVLAVRPFLRRHDVAVEGVHEDRVEGTVESTSAKSTDTESAALHVNTAGLNSSGPRSSY